MLPFIGHMGICTSSGVIRDFAGSYFVSVSIAFVVYLLDAKRESKWIEMLRMSYGRAEVYLIRNDSKGRGHNFSVEGDCCR